MEHDEMDVNRWVDERLSSLDPPDDWRPDSSAAFARLRRRHAPARRRWWLWASLSAAAAAAAGCAVLLLVSTPSACANPLGCRPLPGAVVSAPPLVTARGPQTNFKESGSPTAPVTCELYTDYECSRCAAFYLQTVPQLAARYVDSGKVRLIHRDLPLANHRYARLAALYADAAGEAGYYHDVANRLYRTEVVWSTDGDIDGQVAKVVPPAVMDKMRSQVRNDSSVENSVKVDEARARQKHIDRTPTLLCNGQTIGPNLSFPQIEAQIDPLVMQR
jgi:protein-disulfide isomerase